MVVKIFFDGKGRSRRGRGRFYGGYGAKKI
jgi:hypothetical protein